MVPPDPIANGEPPDRDAPARAAARVAACEAEVWAALLPILARHRCRLVTVQEIINGQPGPVQIRVAEND